MILSTSRKFIFFKTIKTGSTSAEIFLSCACGEEDILTYLPPPDEEIRRSLCGRAEQNNRPAAVERIRSRLRGEPSEHRKHIYHHNISAAELRNRLPYSEWNSYRKITIARNPFDRALSKYYHDRHHQTGGLFREVSSTDHINEYLMTLSDRDLTNWHIYAHEDDLLVDHVMRYENLSAELNDFVAGIGVSNPLPMPHAKGTWRTDRTPYRRVIGNELRRKIENAASKEMELMSYFW